MKRLSSAEFVRAVRDADLSVASVVDAHLDDNEGLLIHLLLPDLLRLAVTRFNSGDLGTSSRILDIVDQALMDGDDALINAVAVSFVEDVGTAPGESTGFLASWPPALLAELRQQQGRSVQSE